MVGSATELDYNPPSPPPGQEYLHAPLLPLNGSLWTAEQNLVKKESEVKAWYNGYRINGLTLYNPWSIMKCLKNKAKLMPYWLNTGDDSLLKELLQKADDRVKEQFQSLVLGTSVRVSVNQTMGLDQVTTDKSMLKRLNVFSSKPLAFMNLLTTLKASIKALC